LTFQKGVVNSTRITGKLCHNTGISFLEYRYTIAFEFMPLVNLSPAEKSDLTKLANAGSGPRLLLRCRIILAASKAESVSEVARTLKTSRTNVNLWIRRFKRDRMQGLMTMPGCGPKVTNGELAKKIQRLAAAAVNEGWPLPSQRAIASELGESLASVNRELRRQHVDLPEVFRGAWRNHAFGYSLIGIFLDPPFTVIAVRPPESLLAAGAASKTGKWLPAFDRQLTALRGQIFKLKKTAGLESSLAGFLRQLQRISPANPVDLWIGSPSEVLAKMTATSAKFRIRTASANTPGGWPHNVLLEVKPFIKTCREYLLWNLQIRRVLLSAGRGGACSRPWFRTLVRPPFGAMTGKSS
jgi:hypothetical protein